jgi:uncharacterized membrane protein
MLPPFLVTRLGELNSTGMMKLMGNLHPAIVHFPIALVTVAAVLEMLQLVRRRPGLASATPALLIFGGLSAIVAAVFGWFSAPPVNDSPEATNLHRWIGIGATVVAVLAMLILVKAVTPNPSEARGAIMTVRLLVMIGAAVIGGAGFLGAEVSFGKGHLFKGVYPKTTPDTPPSNGDVQPPPVAKGDKVDFVRDVAPILKEACLRCHGGGTKNGGKLNIKTKADCLKGGASGVCLVPGNPDKSSLYTLLVEKDEADRMPPMKEERKLTDKEIATIRKWIEQGAEWPDGTEL